MVKTTFLQPPIIQHDIKLKYVSPQKRVLNQNRKLRGIVKQMYQIVRTMRDRNVRLEKELVKIKRELNEYKKKILIS